MLRCFFSRHRRSAASFLNRPDLFLDSDFRLHLSCASQDLKCIGEAVTIKQADGGLESSAVHFVKYPDFYTLALHKCLELVVRVLQPFLSTRLLRTLTHDGRSRNWHEKGFCRFCVFFVSFRPLRSVCVFPPARLKLIRAYHGARAKR